MRRAWPRRQPATGEWSANGAEQIQGNFQVLKKLVVRKAVIHRIAAVEYLILAG